MTSLPTTQAIVRQAYILMLDAGFVAITRQQFGFEIACCDFDPDYNFTKYLWEAAYSEVRASLNPEIRKQSMQAEAEWVDAHLFGL